MLWAEDPILPAKRVRHASERDNDLQGTFREISIAFEVTEEQATWPDTHCPGGPTGYSNGYSALREDFCLYRC